MKTGLRFALLTRVSTPEQAAEGESLALQEKRLREAVTRMGGVVAEVYAGQEHTLSPNSERRILTRMLADADKNRFDAVIAQDLSRFGRHLETVFGAIKELNTKGIQVYDLNGVIDLNNPQSWLSTLILTAVSQFTAWQSAEKSQDARLERAKRGWCQGRGYPWGRQPVPNQDKNGDCRWEVIPAKQAEIDEYFDWYVNKNYSYQKIERLTGVSREQVRTILTQWAGTDWHRQFADHKFITKLPPLLTAAQIQAVRQRARSNRQFSKSTGQYPLAHFVRCGCCGQTLSGGQEPERLGGRRYYIHTNDRKLTRKTEQCTKTIRADALEQAVFGQIGDLFKNTESLRAAIDAMLNTAHQQKPGLEAELKQLQGRLSKIREKRSKVIKHLLSDGLLTPEEQKAVLRQLNLEMSETAQRIGEVENDLLDMTATVPEDLPQQIERYVCALSGGNGAMPATWPPAQQAELAKFVFGTGRNKQLGIFVTQHKPTGRRKDIYYTYQFVGVLGTASGGLAYPSRRVELADMADWRPAHIDLVHLADFVSLLNRLEIDQLPRKVIKTSRAYLGHGRR